MKVVLKVAVAFIPILVVFLWFASPSIWYVIQTDRWEAEIKRNQNPEELRAWALDLVAKYGSRSNDKVTNRPPSTIPQSHEYPMSVFVQSSLVPDDPSGQSYTSHVVLMCGSGFLPGWGMDVGYTNFVSTHLNAEAWVPGIYFFWENH